MKTGNKSPNFGERITHLMAAKGFGPEKRGCDRRLVNEMYAAGLLTNAPDPEDETPEGNNRLQKFLESCRKTVNNHRNLEVPEITCEWLDRYCKFFGCSCDYLMGYIDTPTHEHGSLEDFTGLTEDSIDVLRRLQDEIVEAGNSHSSDDVKCLQEVLNFMIGKCLVKEPEWFLDLYDFFYGLKIKSISGTWKHFSDADGKNVDEPVLIASDTATLIKSSTEGNRFRIDLAGDVNDLFLQSLRNGIVSGLDRIREYAKTMTH